MLGGHLRSLRLVLVLVEEDVFLSNGEDQLVGEVLLDVVRDALIVDGEDDGGDHGGAGVLDVDLGDLLEGHTEIGRDEHLVEVLSLEEMHLVAEFTAWDHGFVITEL